MYWFHEYYEVIRSTEYDKYMEVGWYLDLSCYQETAVQWICVVLCLEELESTFSAISLFTHRCSWLPSSSLPASHPACPAWTGPSWGKSERPASCTESHPESPQPPGPRREACTERLLFPKAPKVWVWQDPSTHILTWKDWHCNKVSWKVSVGRPPKSAQSRSEIPSINFL